MDGLGVAFSSMQTQKNAKDWFEFDPSNFWKDFISNKGLQNLAPNELFQLNLPVCDMDEMDLDKWWACGDTKSSQWQECFLGTVNDYCLKGQKLNGHDWPWDGELNNDDAGK